MSAAEALAMVTMTAAYAAAGVVFALHLIASVARDPARRRRMTSGLYVIGGRRLSPMRAVLVLGVFALFLWPLVVLVAISDALNERNQGRS